MRQIRIDQKDHLPQVSCPYCEATGGGAVVFERISALVRHIKDAPRGTPHDKLKELDGWYRPDWEDFLDMSDERQQRLNREKQAAIDKELLEFGFEYSDCTELPAPIPHETIPGLQRGSPSVWGIHTDFEGVLQIGSPDDTKINVVPACHILTPEPIPVPAVHFDPSRFHVSKKPRME